MNDSAFLFALIALCLGQATLARADDGAPRPLDPVPTSAPKTAVEYVPVVEYVQPELAILKCAIVEVRGNVKRALAETGFRETAGGNRVICTPDDHAKSDSDVLTKILNALSTYAEIEILSRPQIRGLMDQDAEIFIGTEPKPIPYLVKTGNTTFEHRQLAGKEARLGLSAKFSFHPGEEPGQILISPLKFSTTTLDGRELIPGLELDVGKPIISSRTLETSIVLDEGDNVSGITLPGPPDRQLILFLSGRRVRSEHESKLPNPVPGVIVQKKIKIAPVQMKPIKVVPTHHQPIKVVPAEPIPNPPPAGKHSG